MERHVYNHGRLHQALRTSKMVSRDGFKTSAGKRSDFPRIAGFQTSAGNKTCVTSLYRFSLLSRPPASLSALVITMDVDIKIKDEIDEKRTDRDSDRGGRDYDRDRDRDGERSSRRDRSRDRRDSGERLPAAMSEDPLAPTSKPPGRRRNDHYEPDDRRPGGDVRLLSAPRVLH